MVEDRIAPRLFYPLFFGLCFALLFGRVSSSRFGELRVLRHPLQELTTLFGHLGPPLHFVFRINILPGGRFGIHAGYKSMRVDLRDPEQDEGVSGFDLRFDGPVVGLTVAF